jgi:hypothetical protein
MHEALRLDQQQDPDDRGSFILRFPLPRPCFCLAGALLFRIRVPAQAQQPTTLRRTGYISGAGSASNQSPDVEASDVHFDVAHA